MSVCRVDDDEIRASVLGQSSTRSFGAVTDANGGRRRANALVVLAGILDAR